MSNPSKTARRGDDRLRAGPLARASLCADFANAPPEALSRLTRGKLTARGVGRKIRPKALKSLNSPKENEAKKLLFRRAWQPFSGQKSAFCRQRAPLFARKCSGFPEAQSDPNNPPHASGASGLCVGKPRSRCKAKQNGDQALEIKRSREIVRFRVPTISRTYRPRREALRFAGRNIPFVLPGLNSVGTPNVSPARFRSELRRCPLRSNPPDSVSGKDFRRKSAVFRERCANLETSRSGECIRTAGYT